jgi:Pyridoxamine 5'-phosphate oxidase
VAPWQEIVESAPDFAAGVRRHLDARVHKTIATIRADGSPRISGIETFFADDELWFGSMPRARKAIDLRRDPRFALHSGSLDPPDWDGDAKITGRAEEVTDPDRRLTIFRSRGSDPPSSESHLFRADIHEAVLIGLNDARTRLVIELWRQGEELKRMERD